MACKFPITKSIKARRRKQADERAVIYNARSTQEKLDRLPKDGAKKERAKLLLKLEAEKKGLVKTYERVINKEDTQG